MIILSFLPLWLPRRLISIPWLLSLIGIVIIIAVIENISVFCNFSISWKSNILIIVVYYSQTCYNHRHFNELNAGDKMSFYINFYHWRSTLFHPHHALSLLPFKTHSFRSHADEHKSPTQRISPNAMPQQSRLGIWLQTPGNDYITSG